MSPSRYSRQSVLLEVGPIGQARLSQARVLLVGVGGLGSPAALYLAAAGVGTIGLIDPDSVDQTNLQRQVIYRNSDCGRRKVIAAQERLLELNPEITVHAFPEEFTAANAPRLVQEYDLIIEGSDRFSTKFLVNDACYKFGKPLIYGAVDRFEGQVAIFDGRKTGCYRCLYPTPPRAQIRNCAENGVLGPVVGMIGTAQATLAIQYLVSRDAPTHPLTPAWGELSSMDLRGQWQMRSAQISKRENCATCSQPPQSIELGIEEDKSFCTTSLIHAAELSAALNQEHSRIVLLDVRKIDEWLEGHIAGALHWPLTHLENGNLPPAPGPEAEIVTYCRSGIRSQRAADILRRAGIPSVRSLTQGLDSWTGPLALDSSEHRAR